MSEPRHLDPRYRTEIYDGDKIIPGRKSCANALEIDLHFGLWPEDIADQSDSTINSLRHLHSQLRESWRGIALEHLKHAGDESEWPKKRRDQSRAYAESATNSIESKFEEIKAAALCRRVELRHEMELSLENSVSGEVRAQEIRASVRAMNPEDRNEFLNGVSYERDPQVARAIATGHELTTGVGAESIRRLKAEYLEKTCPEEWMRLRQVETGLHLIERAKGAFMRNITQYAESLEKTIPDLKLSA